MVQEETGLCQAEPRQPPRGFPRVHRPHAHTCTMQDSSSSCKVPIGPCPLEIIVQLFVSLPYVCSAPWWQKPCLSPSLLYSQCLAQYPPHSRCPINTVRFHWNIGERKDATSEDYLSFSMLLHISLAASLALVSTNKGELLLLLISVSCSPIWLVTAHCS